MCSDQAQAGSSLPAGRELRDQILRVLDAEAQSGSKQYKNVTDISKALGVSSGSLRRPLQILEGQGFVETYEYANGSLSARATFNGSLHLEDREGDQSREESSGAASERELMELAIELARRSVSEPGKHSPRVGAVVVRGDIVLGKAFRGELTPGEHAEFTLLEKKLPRETLAGATLFTTLEPCTSRNPPKIPCVERVVERRISRVVIGTLDPNEQIRGRGELRLRDAGIEVARFDPDLMAELEELNREFSRDQREHELPGSRGTSGPECREAEAWMKIHRFTETNSFGHLALDVTLSTSNAGPIVIRRMCLHFCQDVDFQDVPIDSGLVPWQQEGPLVVQNGEPCTRSILFGDGAEEVRNTLSGYVGLSVDPAIRIEYTTKEGLDKVLDERIGTIEIFPGFGGFGGRFDYGPFMLEISDC